MERIITYNFNENFIDKVAELIVSRFLRKGNDLSRVVCVFGGKRPALFLRRALSKRINEAFLPPKVFSIDEFVDYLNLEDKPLKEITPLDASFLIYNLVKKHMPEILKGRDSFAQFLPWAQEFISFIEQLDLEDIKNDSLHYVEKSAAIGYEIPDNINRLLQNIVELRNAYHRALEKKEISSRSMKYLCAAKVAKKSEFKDFDAVLFCNFFYLHKTEQKIIKNIYEKGKGLYLFQGSQDDWSVLKNNADTLGVSIRPDKKTNTDFNFSLYQGFDIHSQVCLVREILNKLKNKDDSVVVLPRPETVIPLLTEVASGLDEFNVSMGYSLRRSSLYTLLDFLAKAQESRKDRKYYTKDYLNLLRHPLVKNIKIGAESLVTRVLIHKLEELLQGSEETSIGGSLFLSLSQIEQEEIIYLRTSETLKNLNVKVKIDDCRNVLRALHDLLFRAWEDFTDFSGFSRAFGLLLNSLVEKSMVSSFPFNLKIIEKLRLINEEFENSTLSREKFKPDEIWEIFQQKLRSEKIAFVGSPLRGTQILGLFETRSLNFENIIIMDMNESILPKLKIYEPLIPREVMLSLGLNRLEKEEEIQRYQFMRLVACAKNIHLVYEENREKEKSRFIEELLWGRQREAKKLEVLNIPKASFGVKIKPVEITIKKTLAMVDFLKQETYSASRINTYLRCPLQFYYQYVLGLEENEDLLTTPQSSHIGIFIHELLEETFGEFKGKKPIIDERFRDYFFERMEKKFEDTLSRRMKSDSFLLKKIIKNRLNKFLDSEIERDVEKIICLEQERTGIIKLNNEPINFKYTVDRIDEFCDKSIVIIDYKTGGSDASPKKLDALASMEMNHQAIRDNIKSFQLPIYYYFTSKDFSTSQINAELYNIRTCERKAFIYKTDLEHRDKVMQICLQALEKVISDIFDKDMSFEPDKDERACSYCSFRLLCK